MPSFTKSDIDKAKRMREQGATQEQIGEALREAGHQSSFEANRSRGRRALRALATLRDLPEKQHFTTQENNPKPAKSPLSENAPLASDKLTEAIEQVGDTLTISLPKTRVRTLEQLIQVCEINTDEWTVERFVCNKWEMGYRTDSGADTTELYQVKAWFKRKAEEYNSRQALASALEAVKAHAPVYPMIQRLPTSGDGLLFELSMPDVHVGKLCWGMETGEDYDLRIAQDVFMDAFSHLVDDAKSRTIAKILFPVGNDLLNCDNSQGMTTGGTPQSNDGRFQKVYQVTLGLLVGAIDRLRELAPVDVISIPGNHDTLSAWTITESLRAWYRTAGDVSVDNAPTLRKYYRYGKTLLLFTHGDKEKLAGLPLLMATERPEDWAQTHYREAHLGHRHKSAGMTVTGDEFNGVRVRTLPSLSGTDSWHHGQGYVGNIRSAEAYFWHPERGHAGTAIYNVPKQKRERG
jgi:hypothetical protein